MDNRQSTFLVPRLAALMALALFAGYAASQTPVDEDGNPIGPVYGDDMAAEAAAGDIELLPVAELEELVGPVALYPDDLLAIVLPASTFPLEIVQAARYLEELEADESLRPDDDWDDSVVALLNYPEVLQMMSEDIDWTWRLGEAVVAQQSDVVAAVESFRDRAYAAGNLKSDERQTVSRNAENAVVIDAVEEDVIYVPYYEPADVVVRQPRRVYYYYPDPYPVYYYPYPAGHHFVSGWFWGVTTAFRIGWHSHYLHVHHHSFHGHPYFGWNYYGDYWRRPSITIFNNYYGSWGYRDPRDRYRYGSYWRPRYYGGARPGHYVARSRYYTNRRQAHSEDGYANGRDQSRDERRYSRERDRRPGLTTNRTRTPECAARRVREREAGDIRFRERPARTGQNDLRRNPGQRQDADTVRRARSERRDRDAVASTPQRRALAERGESRRSSGSRSRPERRDAIARTERRDAATRESRRSTGRRVTAPARNRPATSRPETRRVTPSTVERQRTTPRAATTRRAPSARSESARRVAPSSPPRRAAPAPRRSSGASSRSTSRPAAPRPSSNRAAPSRPSSKPRRSESRRRNHN